MTDQQEKSTALVRTDDHAQFGPAMLALPNDRWRGFVRAVVNGANPSNAGRALGFTSNGTGSRLAHDPRIQAALLEEALKLIRVDGVKALHALREIAFDKRAAHRDRLKAIEMILSRGGFAAVTHHQIDVVHKTDAQLKQELLAMADELGMGADAKAKLIGGPVTDAEFVEIVDPPTDIAAPAGPQGPGITDPDAFERRARQRALYRMTPEEREAHNARVREERRERAKREYIDGQASLAGLEDLVPSVEPLAHEVGQETDFNPEDDGETNE